MNKGLLVTIIAFAVILPFIFIGASTKSQNKDTKRSISNPTTAFETEEKAISPSPTKALLQQPEMIINTDKSYSAVIKTDKGDIVVELTAKETPITVNNFVYLARKSFYDGTIFHRVIKGFMIQGGDPQGDGTGGPGYTFEDEITESQTFDVKGMLAMANRGPDTNGSQFFITHGPATWLDGKHTIFGRVISGMEVVDTIATAKVDTSLGGSRPLDPVTIDKIEIIEE